ncbi:hypothetical protein [Clostridium baratii]|uniref:hypothetical protein n=1 Tax=Clostridium baratii TaxID=1561 RepID=UPI00097FA9CD|nr:hypothetical protein [Clostridium baratii]AQM59020.1 hypothetical protein NPD11_2455 [Clostridium baratii]
MNNKDSIYRYKLEEQKKRTIIVRKEKIKQYEIFIKELEKDLEFINSIDLNNYNNDFDIKNRYIEIRDELSKLSIENKDLKNKYNELEKENKILKKRYNALSNSKLGKIMIKYWKFKKGD